MNLALYDKQFLLDLDKYPHRETYCKIIALNWEENPVAEITANVVSGSISVDGKSTVRRTATLQLVTETLSIDTVVWRYQTKIQIYIGRKNNLKEVELEEGKERYKSYDDIIWFPQGIFVITQFNSTSNNNGFTINISAKDKMCLLDGSVGGNLWASHEFSVVWTELNDGTITKTYIPIRDIIKEAIHTYAHEEYGNIIISDLDTCGVELMEYIGTNATMYIFKQRLVGQLRWTDQIAFNTTSNNLTSWFDTITHDTFKDLDEWPRAVTNNGVEYKLQKRVSSTDISKTVGYRATDLTYPGELTIAVGGTIADMLKKICDMLGEFEYFYDFQGRFVFQRKKIYVNSIWTNTIYDGRTNYYDSMATASDLAYDFVRGILIESFSNSPKLDAIKNDYSIWGKRQTATGKEFHVHLRYAIDQKPTIYHSLLDNRTYISMEFSQYINAGIPSLVSDNSIAKINEEYEDNGIDKVAGGIHIGGVYDWRHLIYLMAKDNLRANNNIEGLKCALARGWYHYDEDKISNVATEEPTLYKYDSLTKTMVKITTNKDIAYCKQKHIFMYGPDKTKTIIRLTAEQIAKISEILGYNYSYAQLGTPWISEETKLYRQAHLQDEINLVKKFLDQNDTDLLRSEINAWQGTFNTGYESYYADVLEFWPALYKLEADYSNTVGDYDIATGWKIKKSSSDSYGVETIQIEIDENGNEVEVRYDNATKVNGTDIVKWINNGYWNPNLFFWDASARMVTMTNPENLRFWIDFLDLDNALSYGYVEDPDGEYFKNDKGEYQHLNGSDKDNLPETTTFYSLSENVESHILNNDLSQYRVSMIGRRTKYVNDDKVKAIYFRETPSLLFVSEDFEEVAGQENLNYTRINIAPPISNYFKISSQGKSAKEALDSLLYEGTYSQETISLSTIPIYYLQPNTRIGVHDDNTNINGEYIIKSFSISLAYDGMMSISASRVAERII